MNIFNFFREIEKKSGHLATNPANPVKSRVSAWPHPEKSGQKVGKWPHFRNFSLKLFKQKWAWTHPKWAKMAKIFP